MVSMISRNPDATGVESTDSDVRMAYRSVTQHGSLDWSVLVFHPWSFPITHYIQQAYSFLRKGWHFDTSQDCLAKADHSSDCVGL